MWFIPNLMIIYRKPSSYAMDADVITIETCPIADGIAGLYFVTLSYQ